jgi:hypothetical protein
MKTRLHNLTWSGTPEGPSQPRNRRFLPFLAVAGVGLLLNQAAVADTITYTDLNPVGASYSCAGGVGGGQQAGVAGYYNGSHAAVWSGSAASFVDLNPAGAYWSEAYATSGGQQAGYADVGGPHAALWSGTADSFVDLHPAGAYTSYAYAVSGGKQAGTARIDGVIHAALWSGTAASFVDLDAAVSGAFPNGSDAYGISTEGNTTYVVGDAYDPDGNEHAILWTITVPEPAHYGLVAGLGLIGSALFLRCRNARAR